MKKFIAVVVLIVMIGAAVSLVLIRDKPFDADAFRADTYTFRADTDDVTAGETDEVTNSYEKLAKGVLPCCIIYFDATDNGKKYDYAVLDATKDGFFSVTPLRNPKNLTDFPSLSEFDDADRVTEDTLILRSSEPDGSMYKYLEGLIKSDGGCLHFDTLEINDTGMYLRAATTPGMEFIGYAYMVFDNDLICRDLRTFGVIKWGEVIQTFTDGHVLLSLSGDDQTACVAYENYKGFGLRFRGRSVFNEGDYDTLQVDVSEVEEELGLSADRTVYEDITFNVIKTYADGVKGRIKATGGENGENKLLTVMVKTDGSCTVLSSEDIEP